MKFFLEKKSHNAEKTERVDPLVSPGMVCYAGKQEKPFWFGSLGQIVQSGAIIFCRTFVELFWSVQVVLKNTLTKSHDYSRLFSKEKRRLKNMIRIIYILQKVSGNLLGFLRVTQKSGAELPEVFFT